MLPLVGLAILMGLAFALGGSARGDVSYLTVLRPAAVLCLGFALLTLGRRHLAGQAWPVCLAVAAVALPALHLVPLPPAAWQSLPGRDLIAQIDAAAGLGEVWRPLTLTPPETLNALMAGLLPLGVILLAIQLPPHLRAGLVALPLAAGGLGVVLGLAQLLGDPEGGLYFYEITNNGSPVGLFANRNHQAVALACLIPLAFAAASLPAGGGGSRRRGASPVAWRHPLAVAATCVILPLILVTGSRAGLVAAPLALASLALVLPPAPSRGWVRRAGLALLGLPALVAGLAVWLGRDLALDRLASSSPADDLRLKILPTLWDMLGQYWPLGTGLGSFERAYKVHEPSELLMPTYVNHAHNDWIELALTGGLPALALLAIGLGALTWRAAWVLGPAGADGWRPLRAAALACLIILALASITDYPLRTPHLAALFALCAAWLFLPARVPNRGAEARQLGKNVNENQGGGA